MNPRLRYGFVIAVVLALALGGYRWQRHRNDHPPDKTGANRPAPAPGKNDKSIEPKPTEQNEVAKRNFSPMQLTFLAMNCKPQLDMPAVEQMIGGKPFSLRSLYLSVGIDLQISKAPLFAANEDSACLETTERDADNMLSTYFKTVPYDEHQIVALIARNKGDSDLGIMFERFKDSSAPRQAFAVFVDLNRAQHPNSPSDAAAELLLTTAHELTHCFNLHHCDYDRDADGHQTIEGIEWDLGSFSWNFSEETKRHFAQDPLDEVLPGRGHWPYGKVTAEHKGLHKPLSVELTTGDPGICVPGPQMVAAKGLHLELSPATAALATGEPVFVTIGLHNDSSASRRVFASLRPEDGKLAIEVRQPSASDFTRFAPTIIKERRTAAVTNIGGGRAIHQTTQISAGANGWVFQNPGSYEIRATLWIPAPGANDGSRVSILSSDTVRIRVDPPANDADKLAAKIWFGSEQERFLALEGSDHLTGAMSDLSHLIATTPISRQANIARLLLANAYLHPTVNLQTGLRPAPRFLAAANVLSGLKSGEGLPALFAFRTYNQLADILVENGKTGEAAAIRQEATSRFGKDEAIPRPPTTGIPRTNDGFVLHGLAKVAPHWSGNVYPTSISHGTPYYLVRRGDSLWAIADRLYGRPNQWESLQELNQFLRNPNLLYPGDPVILLPETRQ